MQYLLEAATSTWHQFQYVCLIYCVGMAIEWLRPAQNGQPAAHIGFNIGYTFIFLGLTNLLVPPLQAITKPWIEQWGLHIPISFPDSVWGQTLQTLAFLFIFDFFYYWFHRAQHTLPWFWAQHKLHHSEFSLNITTGNRHHWLEEPIRVFLIGLPIGLLFQQKAVVIAWLWSGFLLWGYFIHMNLRLNLGPLTPIVGGPQLHRIHHSNLPQHCDKNFAAFFPVFDILFGTYCRAMRDEYPTTGLHNSEDLNGLVRASAAPFVAWTRGAMTQLRFKRNSP